MAAEVRANDVQPESHYRVDPSWRPLYKIGAVALLIAGVAYLIIPVTSAIIHVGPENSMKYFHALTNHSGTAFFTYTVVAIADFVLVPAALALYLALRGLAPGWMLLATVILLTYVAMDISTFVSVAFALVALGHEPQSTAIVGAEHFGLATVQLSQFIGWVYPAIAYLIIAVVIRVRGLGRITALLGFLVFLTNIVGGISFLHPVNSVEKYQDPGLFLLGLYSLALGTLLFKLDNQSSPTPART